MTFFSLPGAADLLAAELDNCFLRKSQGFRQRVTGALEPWSSKPFGFWADIYTDSSNSVTAASLLLTDGSPRTPTWTEADYRPTSYSFRADFTNAQTLELTYVPGTYTFKTSTTNATYSIPLSLPLGSFPNAPCVINLAAAQSVDPSADFLLQWTPFAEATPADDIQVELWAQTNPRVATFKAPTDPPFAGTNTSIVIPRGTLLPGQTYICFLVFRSISDRDTTSWSGVVSTAAYDTFTYFILRTVASPVLQISLAQTNVMLSWPTVYAGFTLERVPNIGSISQWAPITNVPEIEDESYALTLPRTNALMYFRLVSTNQ